jgi:hypothetical protein
MMGSGTAWHVLSSQGQTTAGSSTYFSPNCEIRYFFALRRAAIEKWRYIGQVMSELAPDDLNLGPNPEVIAKRLGQAAVLVHIPTNRIFELNETGTRVWELLGQGLDPHHIVRQLVEEFAVEHDRAAEEVRRLLVQLRTEGLLVS